MTEKYRPAPTPDQLALLEKFKQARDEGGGLMQIGDEPEETTFLGVTTRAYRTSDEKTLAAYGGKVKESYKALPRTQAWYALRAEASSGAARKRWHDVRETYLRPWAAAVNIFMALRYHCRAWRFYLAGCFAPSGV